MACVFAEEAKSHAKSLWVRCHTPGLRSLSGFTNILSLTGHKIDPAFAKWESKNLDSIEYNLNLML
ncbi:MAG TPA: hypothetical protein VJ946_00590, partial [Bacteroidales bacterium]|nr:hypothetical protein [Bacteroidales bacterium]